MTQNLQAQSLHNKTVNFWGLVLLRQKFAQTHYSWLSIFIVFSAHLMLQPIIFLSIF